MTSLTARLSDAVANLSLRSTIAIALVLGLSLPIALSAWRDLAERRDSLLAELEQDHARILEVLAIGMQTPIWDVRPETGQPLLDALMRDERVIAITITAPMLPDFLVARDDSRARGEVLSRESPVVRHQEPIGKVRVDMSTRRVETEIVDQWSRILVTGFLQVGLGILIIFQLLRFKVLTPVDRLVEQSQALATGRLNEPLDWRRNDELGVLGQSFEETRRSLRKLIDNLESRNREVFEREAELANKTAVLRATLENMTDGITFVDKDLKLVIWNDRLPEILGIPRDFLREGAAVKELMNHDLRQASAVQDRGQEMFDRMLESFDASGESSFRYRSADGRDVDVRRRPIPDGGFVSTYTDVTEQVAALRKANETRQLLESVMDTVPAVINVKDSALQYEMVNRTFAQFWGVDKENAAGKTDLDFFEGEVLAEAEQRDRRVLETRRRLPFYETSVRRGQPNELTTWSTKIPLLDQDGEVNHILTVDMDITERKRAEQERQRWLQLFEDAVESIRSGFAVFDSSQRLVACNTAYVSLFEKSKEEMVGLIFAEIQVLALQRIKTVNGRPAKEAGNILGSTAEEVWRFWQQNDEAIEVELLDGRWMQLSRHRTAEEGMVFLRTDITDLKRMQQALGESEERFRSIAEAHPLPVVITRRRDDSILYASPAAAELWGRPQSEILGSSVAGYYADPTERARPLELLRDKGYLESYEVRYHKADGSPVPAAITSRIIVYDGEEAVITGIFDLTERKAAEQQIAEQREALYQSEKLNALGALLAGVSHELNNPLSVVVGQALMLKETAIDAATRKRAETIANAADRCSRIVKTFLAMARQSSPQRRQVDLQEVVESALEITGYTLRSAGIEVTRQLDDGLPPVWADPDQLAQVLMNLIVNAEQALAEQAPPRKLLLAARAHPVSGEVRLIVRDNGPGIPAEVRSRMFEPFFTTKEDGVGTGVGLAVSQGIVASHGGRIEVSSEPGGGAEFTLTLPRSRSRLPTAAEQPGERAESRVCRILVVDDEPEVAEMLTDILSLSGHQLETARSGHTALELIAKNDYDFILSDLRMPDLDGPGLFQRLKDEHPRLAERIAFITGDALGSSVRAFLERSGRPYLEKPFAPKEVRELVERMIGETCGADGETG